LQRERERDHAAERVTLSRALGGCDGALGRPLARRLGAGNAWLVGV
jgi:hypothetical protein